MRARRFVLVYGLLAASGCGGPPPPPPELALPPTADTVIVPMVVITAAAPLSDGRWVVLAPEEGAVRAVNFADGTIEPIAGATDVASPGPAVLFAVGDTIVVGSWSNQQFVTWLHGTTRLDTKNVPAALNGAFPQARDAAGQWYFEIGPPPGRDGSGLRDSAAVVRADAGLTRFDTLARLAPGDLATVVTAEGTRTARRAMAGRERWGVERDGTLWIARLRENFIEWHPAGNGKSDKTKRLPDPVLPLQEMDRQIYVNRFPEEYRENARQVPFAAVKPPFEAVLQVRPGTWLLEKNGLALDSTRAFQLADKEGVIRRIIAPSRGNALGFDGTHLLMAEQFPGGVRLLRYLVPPNMVSPRAAES